MTGQKNNYQMLWELHKETIDTIKNFTIAIERLNDEHASERELLNKTLDRFNETMITNAKFVSLVSKLLLALVSAIIILAGAEKALKFF